MANVVITGCNRGLGLTLLKEFAKSKYNVIACTRIKNDDFVRVCDQIEEEENIKIYPIYFELNNKNQILKGMDDISKLNIEIDVLINNAGINIIKPLMFTEYEEIETSFRINYFAPVLIAKMISDLMIRQNKGVIINVSSMGSLGHQAGGSCYDASKAALNQFTISVAQELAPFNIRVNAVACGPMNTEMFNTMKEDIRKKLTKIIALKRASETEEIANVIFFLVSEKASFITGQIVRVDGGAII